MTAGSSGEDGDAAWRIAFDGYDPADEGRREAIFALGNGRFVTRAALADVRHDGAHYPGTYHAGCYNRLDSSIAGEQEQTESIVNLPNWLPLSVRILGGPWLTLDETTVVRYRHCLDMRGGIACRDYVLRDVAGGTTRIREQRLVSMDAPHLCALRLEFTPLDWSGEVEVFSALDADVRNANVPRYADYANRHLVAVQREARPGHVVMLRASTSTSGIRIAQAQRTVVDRPVRHVRIVDGAGTADEDTAIAQVFTLPVQAGRTLAVEKHVALCVARKDAQHHDDGALADEAARAAATAGSFALLRARHEEAWRALWQRAAIEIENPEVARPIRLHAFHILQTLSPHSAALDISVPARGWHGEVYHGQIFWDELFVLPFLILRFPHVARGCLLYRYRRLDAARRAAQLAGHRGAMYPWRSASDGSEATPSHQKNLLSGAWMRDHTYLQRHVGAAIAFNVWHYYLASGDDDFLAACGAEMMLEIARFWASMATPRDDGRYGITGVMGPDEYHDAYPGRGVPGLDNNAYTNVMAAWTLCRGLDVLHHLPPARAAALRRQLDLRDAELAQWEHVSRHMYVPFLDDGILNQFDGFDRLDEFDAGLLPQAIADKRTDWALGAIGRSADEFQITKQADALTLFYLLPEDEVIGMLHRLGYPFDRGCIRRTARYYLARTTHRSSLSRVVYAGALAQVDQGASWDFYRQVLRTDLDPLKGESISEGIHIGAMGGAIDILQRRYLGIHLCAEGLLIDPALPAQLGKVRMAFRYRGAVLEAEGGDGCLSLRVAREDGVEVPFVYRGRQGVVGPGAEVRFAL